MVQNISIQIAIWIIFGACKQCKSHTGLPRMYRSAFAGLSSFCEFFASQRLAPLLPLGFDPETEASQGVTQPTTHIKYKLAVGYLKLTVDNQDVKRYTFTEAVCEFTLS